MSASNLSFLNFFVLSALVVGQDCSCDITAENRVSTVSRRLLTDNIRFKIADDEVRGEYYQRPGASSKRVHVRSIENSPACTSSQIMVFLGDDSTSAVIAYAAPTLAIDSVVQYSTNEKDILTNSKQARSAIGIRRSYSELLYFHKNVVDPYMGAPETTTEYLLSIQDTTDFAYDEVTGEHFSNWYNYSRVDWGMGRYNNPDVIYDSPLLHRVVLDGLTPGKKYFYRVQGSCKVYSFSLPPSATASPTDFPYRIGLTADIGQTLVSEKSVQALLALLPDVVLLPGDLSYADGYMPLWDSFGDMFEPLAATVPVLTTGGNHELASGESWQSYQFRYFTPHQGSGSPNMGYWAKAVGPVLVIALNSYSNMTRGSTQYEWADSYLSSKVDRYLTPWVVVMMHVPWYNSNTGHWKEAERGRQHMEPLLFQYGVDVIIAGHVHSYERTHPILEFERNECGPMYLNLGDGSYVPWRWENSSTGLDMHNSSIGEQPPWSAFRESSFGVAELVVLNNTHMSFSWHRHACMSDSEETLYMNFSDSCVTPGDDSVSNMVTSDAVMIVRPADTVCANRHISTSTGVVTPSGVDKDDSAVMLSSLEIVLICCVMVLVVTNIVAYKYYYNSKSTEFPTDRHVDSPFQTSVDVLEIVGDDGI